jgi:RHS repeat-associated protein
VAGVGRIDYFWDFEGRMVGAMSPTETLAFGYDVDGIRNAKSVNGIVTRFVVDKNRDFAQVLEERDPSGSIVNVAYVYGDDLISQERPGNQFSFYHYDGQLSTRQLTDGAANITDTYTYDAFGVLLASSGTTPNNYLYTGEQFDGNLGFYYLRARYLDSGIGRFLSQDPFDGTPLEPESLHKYVYANVNSVHFRDPSGLIGIAGTIGAIGISLSLAAIGAKIYSAIFTFSALNELAEFAVDLNNAPLHLLTILEIRTIVVSAAINLLGQMLGLVADIAGEVVKFIAYGILFAALVGAVVKGIQTVKGLSKTTEAVFVRVVSARDAAKAKAFELRPNETGLSVFQTTANVTEDAVVAAVQAAGKKGKLTSVKLPESQIKALDPRLRISKTPGGTPHPEVNEIHYEITGIPAAEFNTLIAPQLAKIGQTLGK